MKQPFNSLSRLNRILRAAGPFVVFLVTICATAFPARAAVKTWDGSSSGNWATGANWSGGTAPVDGDELRFPASPTRKAMTNNITDLEVTLLWFNEDESDGYTLRGNALKIVDAVTIGIYSYQTNGLNTIDCDITFTNIFTFPYAFIFTINPNGALDINGNILLGRHSNSNFPPVQLTVRSEGTVNLSGVISGPGLIVKNGAGTTTFDGSGSNTYTNQTVVEAGTLQLNKHSGAIARTAIPGDLFIGSGGGTDILKLLFDDQIGNNSDVTVIHRLDLNGHSDTIGSLMMYTSSGSESVITNGGILTVSSNVSVLATSDSAIDADVNLGATTHTFSITNASASLRINGAIIGAGGGLIKAGAGTLTFVGSTDNTYTGPTTVTGGVLELGKSGAFAIQGSTLSIGDTADGNNNTDRVRYLDDNQMTVGVGIIIDRTGVLDLNNFTDDVGTLDLIGGTIQTGSGTLDLRGNVTATASSSGLSADSALITGHLDLGANNRTFTVNDDIFLGGLPVDLIVNATVSGSGTAGIIKNGDGEMELNGANSYAGATTVNDGVLIAGDDSALGTGAAGTTVAGSGTLELAGGLTITGEALTLNSSASGPGALFGAGVTNFWGASIVLSNAARIGVETNSVLNLNGAISGPGSFTKEDDGKLIFTGAGSNSWAGLTTVNGGTVFLNKTGNDNSIPGDLLIGDGLGGTNSDLVFYSSNQIDDQADVTIASSGELVLGADTIGSLSGTGRVDVLTTGTLVTGNNNASTTYSGLVTDGGGLTKVGTGTFTLTRNNNYTGPTRVQAGTLVVNGSQGGSDVTVLAGATLAGKGSIGDLNVATSGIVSPGTSAGRLTVQNTVFSNDAVLNIEINGPVAGTSYDQLDVNGTLNITGSDLAVSLGFSPSAGQVFRIIDNNGSDAVTGTFDGLANNAILTVNQVPMQINYNGGSGNDVTLTVTNLPLTGGTAAITTGNGDGRLDPDECNILFLPITNVGATTLTNVTGTLSSSTPGVIVTEIASSYGNLAAGASRTNLVPFQFITTSGFLCGESAEFILTVSATNHQPFAVRYVVPSGLLSSAQSFTNSAGATLPGSGTINVPLVVSNITGNLAKVTVSVVVSYPALNELFFSVIPPGGPAIPLAVSLAGSQLGTNCTNGRAVFDDDAALSINDAASPYVGTFQPLVPLSTIEGRSSALINGTWNLQVQDLVPNASFGSVLCWYVTIRPSVCGPGTGPCDICNGPFFGSITNTDLLMVDRVPFGGTPSVCGVTKACSTVATPSSRYDLHTFTNASGASCVTVTLDSPCTESTNSLACAAYLGSFNPANVCQNYLGDIGSYTNSPASFSFNVPSNAVFVVVVDGNASVVCPDYTLRVDGFECPVALDIDPPVNGFTPITWPTHASAFNLEANTNLVTTNWIRMTNQPVVIQGDFVITNNTAVPARFYRLHRR